MNRAMNETFLIHIEIAGRRYPITIQRDKEESMRAAAKQINQKVLQYQSKYFEDKIRELNDELDKYLKDQ